MHVIDFTPEGTVQAMHNDGFDLSFLGKQSITRASEIKFNEDTQRWGIWLHRDDHHFSFDGTRFNRPLEHADGFLTYDGARKVEVEWLNACRLAGVAPSSMQGRTILIVIRHDHPDA